MYCDIINSKYSYTYISYILCAKNNIYMIIFNHYEIFFIYILLVFDQAEY